MHLLRPLSSVIKRFPGDPRSGVVREKAHISHASDPTSWEYDACSHLVWCIVDDLGELYKDDIAIGTTILGLLPSILIIAAAQAQDIVLLALVSPHRAIAASVFGVAISPSLFRRLAPFNSPLSDVSIKTWDVKLARVTKQLSWRHVVAKLSADAAVSTLACVTLWQNWIINSAVMVQWLCESPLMIFAWPLMNMTWVVFSVLLLYGMAEEVRFEHVSQNIRYTSWELFVLPYTLDFEKRTSWGLK
ncbi:hypothetical protein FGRMN_10907 [Fusarium graminum]|nr:hypothetical protein FGRMN_10907 [Fusarium graminum]